MKHEKVTAQGISISQSAKDTIIEDTLQKVRSYLESFDSSFEDAVAQSAVGIPTMDQVETIWGNLSDYTREAYSEMVSEYLSSLDEKKVIESKKESI